MPQANFLAPTALVIYGVTGDLTKRKLVPALYELKLADRLPNPFYVIGYARRDWSDQVMRDTLRQGISEFARSQPVNEQVVEQLLGSMRYLRAPFEESAGYQRLAGLLRAGYCQLPALPGVSAGCICYDRLRDRRGRAGEV